METLHSQKLLQGPMRRRLPEFPHSRRPRILNLFGGPMETLTNLTIALRARGFEVIHYDWKLQGSAGDLSDSAILEKICLTLMTRTQSAASSTPPAISGPGLGTSREAPGP